MTSRRIAVNRPDTLLRQSAKKFTEARSLPANYCDIAVTDLAQIQDVRFRRFRFIANRCPRTSDDTSGGLGEMVIVRKITGILANKFQILRLESGQQFFPVFCNYRLS